MSVRRDDVCEIGNDFLQKCLVRRLVLCAGATAWALGATAEARSSRDLARLCSKVGGRRSDRRMSLMDLMALIRAATDSI